MVISWQSIRFLSMLVLLILLSGPAVLRGQTRNEKWKQCGGNDPDRAIEACSAVIQSGQDMGINVAAAFYDRGVAYSNKGDFDRAIQDYDQSIRHDANFPKAFYSRGLAYEHKGDNDRAIQDYDQALRINQSYAEVFYSRGRAYAN